MSAHCPYVAHVAFKSEKSSLKSLRAAKEAIPTPITTKKPVQNLPKSTTALPALSMKSSGFAHFPHMKFGNGAMTYVATTSRVR